MSLPDTPTQSAPRPKLSWSEKRERRRRRRRTFEEVLGWLLVPALLYGGYLLVQALGGIPPAAIEFASELFTLLVKSVS